MWCEQIVNVVENVSRYGRARPPYTPAAYSSGLRRATFDAFGILIDLVGVVVGTLRRKTTKMRGAKHMMGSFES